MKLKTKAILMLTIFLVASATLGCIGKKPEEVTPTPTPTPEKTPTPTPTIEKTLTPTPTVTVTETPTVPVNVTTHTVLIDKSAFAPSVKKISIGDSIKWRNEDLQRQMTYTIKGTNDAWKWDEFEIKFLKNHTITFDTSGVYNYSTKEVPAMKGTIIVE